MEHGDGTAELRPYRRVARNGKIHFAEFARIASGVLMLGNRGSYECRADGHEHYGNKT
jgi:hypothetical protein